MKNLTHIKRFNDSTINEYFGGSSTEEFKHKLEDLNTNAVLEGLDLLRHYRPEDYYKFFGDRIFKSYKTNESSMNDGFKVKAKKLINDTKKLKDDYPEKQYNKIIELEKLIDGTEEDRKMFVKSIMRLLGMTKFDLPDELYRYL